MSVFHTIRSRLRNRSLALTIVLGYAILALLTERGVEVAGTGLDPVWAAAQQRGTLRIAVDYGFRPFTDIVGNTPRGYDIDLARAVAQKLRLRAEFVPSGLDSIYDDLASGKADLAASALPYAPEQGWRVAFSEFYLNAGQVLVVARESVIATEADLHGQRIGVALGTDADSYARSLAQRSTIQLISSYETPAEACAALRTGQLDAVITDNVSALTELNRAPGLKLVTALTLEPYVLAMPVAGFRLRTAVNQALTELRSEGFFERNGATWFVPTEP